MPFGEMSYHSSRWRGFTVYVYHLHNVKSAKALVQQRIISKRAKMLICMDIIQFITQLQFFTCVCSKDMSVIISASNKKTNLNMYFFHTGS